GLSVGTTGQVGTNGTQPIATFSANTSFAGVVVDNKGVGDLFTASHGGVPSFTIQNNGTIVDSNYTTAGGVFYGTATGAFGLSNAGSPGQLLQSNGSSAPSWISTSSVNFWQRNSGALSPLNITDDLLLGGSSTASARFAFTNAVGLGTPTASLSAGIAGGMFFDASGNLQTTANQNLSIGGGATGNISIAPKSGGNLGI